MMRKLMVKMPDGNRKLMVKMPDGVRKLNIKLPLPEGFIIEFTS